jgi:hypothetical protein
LRGAPRADRLDTVSIGESSAKLADRLQANHAGSGWGISVIQSGEKTVIATRGTPLEQMGLSDGTRTYLIAETLGSVRAAVNSSGTVLATTSYDSYGTPPRRR